MQILATWWGDWSSLLGLVVGIIGFVLTVALVLKSKSAAESARDEATKVSDRISRALTLTDLSSAIGLAKEIMRSQGNLFSEKVLDRCNDLKIMLVRIRAENPALTVDQMADFLNFISDLSSLEGRMRTWINNKDIQKALSARDYKMLSDIQVFLESLTASSKINAGGRTR